MVQAVMSCELDEGLKVVVEVDVKADRFVRREKFPQRSAMRILLVEADDSTRKVIGALLRKCGYKVSGVCDGLKAWEVLKRMPNSVDLILAEVDLPPSISGFALLTLITEHESCKNIPVIMMSSNDSVNMVYKCMMKGAADFLVKPVRKNELQNLWQHVWRRQTLKAEGLSDNDLLINLSYGACTPETEECNEKRNDAQSSCSVQDIEAESASGETTSGNSKLIVNKFGVCDTGSNVEERVEGNSATFKPNSVVKGLLTESHEDAALMFHQEDPGGKNSINDRNTANEASGNNDAVVNGYREAIDLLGNFQEHATNSCINSSVITGSTKFDPCPQLDLSLRRRYDDSKSHQDTIVDGKTQVVHQSSASAFSRYIAAQPSLNTLATMPRECETRSDKRVYSPIQSHQSTQKSFVHQATTELRQGEVSLFCAQGRMLPVTISVKSVRLDNTCPSDGYSLHPSYYNQTGDSPTPSRDSASTSEMLSQVTQEPYTSCSDQDNNKTSEHLRNASSTNERSQNQNINLCNGSISRLNNIGGGGSACGSNGSGDGNLSTRSKADGISTQDENIIYRALLREAALTKFRRKRKDRCFDKKVRYDSRKKLAEQRPRVKGQFVRQVPADVFNHNH